MPRFLQGGPWVLTASAVVLVAAAMTLAPRLFTQRDPNAIAFLERLQPPSLSHPLGTDENGRDIWARVVHGARPTLTAALSLIGLSLVAGSLAGLVIGASGRRSDVLSRLAALVSVRTSAFGSPAPRRRAHASSRRSIASRIRTSNASTVPSPSRPPATRSRRSCARPSSARRR